MSVFKKVTFILVIVTAFFSGSVKSLLLASAQASNQPSCEPKGGGGTCAG